MSGANWRAMTTALSSVVASCEALRVEQRFPDQLGVAAHGQLRERGQRKSAPGRAKHREPCRPVAEVMKCLQQRHEVAHDRDVPQRHEIHPDRIDADCGQRLHDRRGVRARHDEHSNRRIRGHLANLTDAVGNEGRLGFAIAIAEEAQADGLLPPRIARRETRSERDRARPHIVISWKEPREQGVGPCHQRRRRAEVSGQLQWLHPDIADAVLARAQEQADLGLAEQIDRLHRASLVSRDSGILAH